MLNDVQQDQLLLSLYATAETMGQQLSQPAALMMVEDLCQHTEQVLVSALRACRIEGGRLTTALILKHAQAADGRPGKDEAWSIALTASDESETVIMTAEIQQAMTASQPVLALGDKVGARMAFMSAYERLVTKARVEAVPTTWSVSLGFDPARRVTAIESAVRMQLISQQAGTQYLTDLRIAPITVDGQAIAGLLTGSSAQPSASLRSRWQQVRDDLQAHRRRKDIQGRWDSRSERRRFASRKAEQMKAAEQLASKESL